jgi:hypothetical protein
MKILDPTGARTSNPSVVQAVGSRYTDYATTTHGRREIDIKFRPKSLEESDHLEDLGAEGRGGGDLKQGRTMVTGYTNVNF